MARALLFISLLFPLLSIPCGGYDFIPPGPKEVFRSEGGSLRRWGPSETLEQWVGVAVVELTLEPGGFLLPRYLNTVSVGYVLEGCARARVVTPFGPVNLRRLKQGDVIAIPDGYVMGLHNDGSKRSRVLGVADAAAAYAQGLKNITPFMLFGNHDDTTGGASVLNGFSKDALAAAWNVDEPTVEKLLTSQKGAFIIKLEEKERARWPAPRAAATWPFGDVSFNLEGTQPEIVTEGGSLNFVNEFKMPVLKKVGMSAGCAKLKPNAIFAPGWSPNAHQVVYFTRGKGRIQVAAPGGKNELDQEVSAGQLVIIPKHFPATKLAARDSPLEWVTVMTSPAPVAHFLAWENSVYKAFPFDWLVAGFNVDPELEKKVLSARTDECVILTRPKKRDDVSERPKGSVEKKRAAGFLWSI